MASTVRIGIAFDFDGVLFDTYTPVKELLTELFGDKADAILAAEDVAEYFGLWDRRLFYRMLGIGEKLHELIWVSRVQNPRPILAPILWRLKALGIPLFIVCGRDATRDEKLRRILFAGIHLLVDDIEVYEPGGLLEALNAIVSRWSLDKLVYLDDKPCNVCIASRHPRVEAYRVAFQPPYPLKLAWRGCRCKVKEVKPSFESILEIITGV